MLEKSLRSMLNSPRGKTEVVFERVTVLQLLMKGGRGPGVQRKQQPWRVVSDKVW